MIKEIKDHLDLQVKKEIKEKKVVQETKVTRVLQGNGVSGVPLVTKDLWEKMVLKEKKD